MNTGSVQTLVALAAGLLALWLVVPVTAWTLPLVAALLVWRAPEGVSRVGLVTLVLFPTLVGIATKAYMHSVL